MFEDYKVNETAYQIGSTKWLKKLKSLNDKQDVGETSFN